MSKIIKIDNTGWNEDIVKTFTSVPEFVAAHSSVEWFTSEYLTKVYGIINGTSEPIKDKQGKSGGSK